MRFDLSEDQRLLRDSARNFFAAEFPLETSRRVMEHEPRGFDATAWKRVAEMGYVGLAVPEAASGQGLGMIELAIVLEEVGRACVPGPYLDVVLAAELLRSGGEQENLLGEIASGEKIVVIAEDDSPFAGGVHGTGTTFANGRVHGRKYFVPFAADAHVLLVTTPDGAYRVDGPLPGAPLPTFDPSQRFARVDLDHPAQPIADGAGIERLRRISATAAAAELLGVMTRAFDLTLDYVKTRQTFGRAIGSFQALQHRLAEMMLRVESSRAAVYRAAWCIDHGDPQAALAAASAKAYAGDSARLVCGESIQMHGGIGFTWELDLHFYLKRAKTLEVHHGSTETQLERALVAAGL